MKILTTLPLTSHNTCQNINPNFKPSKWAKFENLIMINQCFLGFSHFKLIKSYRNHSFLALALKVFLKQKRLKTSFEFFFTWEKPFWMSSFSFLLTIIALKPMHLFGINFDHFKSFCCIELRVIVPSHIIFRKIRQTFRTVCGETWERGAAFCTLTHPCPGSRPWARPTASSTWLQTRSRSHPSPSEIQGEIRAHPSPSEPNLGD